MMAAATDPPVGSPTHGAPMIPSSFSCAVLARGRAQNPIGRGGGGASGCGRAEIVKHESKMVLSPDRRGEAESEKQRNVRAAVC